MSIHINDTPRTDTEEAMSNKLPHVQAHEAICKSIGDMAEENKRLEESLESANTFLQLVMCEQNHLRDLRNKANDRIQRLEEELMDANNKYAVLVADAVLYEDRGERIKRLEETLEAVTDKLDNAWGIYMEFKEVKP
jgi:archaellum component FlaC